MLFCGPYSVVNSMTRSSAGRRQPTIVSINLGSTPFSSCNVCIISLNSASFPWRFLSMICMAGFLTLHLSVCLSVCLCVWLTKYLKTY